MSAFGIAMYCPMDTAQETWSEPDECPELVRKGKP